MFHYAFLVLILVLGSGTSYAIDVSGTSDPTPSPTAHVTTGNTLPTPAPTDPAPVTTGATTVPPPAPTTAPTNGTTAAPPAPTTAPTNRTTAAPPAPTTAPTNRTTAAPPAPTTAPTNGTTAAPPAPTTVPTNGTTAAPPTPTAAPTNGTTPTPSAPTNGTTAAPPVPTTLAPTPMPQPAVGNYSIRNLNGTICLMATMGLQISYEDGKIFKNVNLDPDTTLASGKCGVDGSDASLVLTFDKSSITFTFREEGEKFSLHVVNVSLVLGATGTFSAANANLSMWEASVGSSYMCRRDQTYNITDVLVLHTKDLQVQPYNVQNGGYATAHDCAMDDTSILIPIVVGAALAGLILIVMIAYAIGRRKTYVGYQTL